MAAAAGAGRPGRPRKSAKVIQLTGNRSKLSKKELAEREAAEPRPHPVAPKMPADLSDGERACWELHAPELDRLGLLTVLDGASFRLLVCQPFEMAAAARGAMLAPAMKADGTPDRRRRSNVLQVVTVDPEHGGALRRHPAFIVWKQAIDLYRQGCAHFGLTPSSRVGLRPGAPVGSVPDDEDDDGAFFGA